MCAKKNGRPYNDGGLQQVRGRLISINVTGEDGEADAPPLCIVRNRPSDATSGIIKAWPVGAPLGNTHPSFPGRKEGTQITKQWGASRSQAGKDICNYAKGISLR